jgi:hypothetical protein
LPVLEASSLSQVVFMLVSEKRTKRNKDWYLYSEINYYGSSRSELKILVIIL